MASRLVSTVIRWLGWAVAWILGLDSVDADLFPRFSPLLAPVRQKKYSTAALYIIITRHQAKVTSTIELSPPNSKPLRLLPQEVYPAIFLDITSRVAAISTSTHPLRGESTRTVHSTTIYIQQTGNFHFPQNHYNGQTDAARPAGKKLELVHHRATEDKLSNRSATCWASCSRAFPPTAQTLPQRTPSTRTWRTTSHTVFSFPTLKLCATMTKCSRSRRALFSRPPRSMLTMSVGTSI